MTNIFNNKKIQKPVSLILSICLALGLACTSFAVDEQYINTSGGSASSPVKFSTVDAAGKPAPTKMIVTVPLSIPIILKEDGTVVTADTAYVENLSYGAVRIKSVVLSTVEGWSLTKYDDASTLANEKVGSNKIGFTMALGDDGDFHSTDGKNTSSQTLIAAPEEGCYMSGGSDTDNNKAYITYDAIATPVAETVTNTMIANLVFTVEWDTV